MTRPGTILSQMPRKRAASKVLCESATPAASAITSREKSDSSIPAWPCVTPSHMAGTPPATWAVAPAARGGAADQVGVVLVGLVGREHVVVGGHDSEVRQPRGGERILVGPHCRIGMGLIAARQMRARRTLGGCQPDPVKIGRAGAGRTAADGFGDVGDAGVEGHLVLRVLAAAVQGAAIAWIDSANNHPDQFECLGRSVVTRSAPCKGVLQDQISRRPIAWRRVSAERRRPRARALGRRTKTEGCAGAFA